MMQYKIRKNNNITNKKVSVVIYCIIMLDSKQRLVMHHACVHNILFIKRLNRPD